MSNTETVIRSDEIDEFNKKLEKIPEKQLSTTETKPPLGINEPLSKKYPFPHTPDYRGYSDLTCLFCDFTAKHNFGIHGHMRARHDVGYYEKFPTAKKWSPGRLPKNKFNSTTPLSSPEQINITSHIPPSENITSHIPLSENITSQITQSENIMAHKQSSIERKSTGRPPRKEPDVMEIEVPYDSDYEIDATPVMGRPKNTITKVTAKKSMDFTGRNLHIAEQLINSGFARNLSELQNKALELTFQIVKEGGNGMFGSNQPKNVAEALQQLKMSELEDLQLDEFRSKIEELKNRKGNNPRIEEPKDSMFGSTQERGGENTMMKDFMQMMMFKSMMEGDKKTQPTFAEMAQLIQVMNSRNDNNDIYKMMEMAKMMTGNDKKEDPLDMMQKMKLMFDQSGSQNNQMKEVLQFLKEKEKSESGSRSQIEQMRQQHTQDMMNARIEELQRHVSSRQPSDWDPAKLKETISAIRGLNDEIGNEKEPSALDYISTLGEHFGSALTELIKSKAANKPSTPQGMGRFIPPRVVQPQDNDVEESDEEVIERHRQVQSIPNPRPVQPIMPDVVGGVRITEQSSNGNLSTTPLKKREYESMIPQTPPEMPGYYG
ncbi:MAG: hypothetical protein Q8O68_00485 [Candidatus Daviesbacteria bacterium]|nr:hypothetical protein [Candidatus Daviesbacteria bacterium]